ncbi:unnamed protein product [Closterium sp. NIES-53]
MPPSPPFPPTPPFPHHAHHPTPHGNHQTPLKGQLSRVRLPFPRPAASRKDVKDLIVEMTRQAQGTSGQK